ncbi:Ribosome biogenesis protein BOP1 [Glycine soja]
MVLTSLTGKMPNIHCLVHLNQKEGLFLQSGKLKRAICQGLITFDKTKEEDSPYLLWGDDSGSTERANHLTYIPAPNHNHDESYNPPLEYIPTEEEINFYQLMFASMRSIPAYENAMKYCFERCLDLYLCPRVRKNRLNIDPESLKPKLPSRKELKPYPTTCYRVGWRWVPYFLLSSMAQVMELFVSGRLKLAHVLGSGRLMNLLVVLLEILCPIFIFWLFLCNQTPSVSWIKDDKHMGLKLRHFKIVTAVEWHQKGDYFSIVIGGCSVCFSLTISLHESRAILIHQLSKKLTQKLPFKLHRLVVRSTFHPSCYIFFVCTKKSVRVYDLLKTKIIKSLDTGLHEASSIAVHPEGDNLIVGSKEGKMCWFDMDLLHVYS